MKKSKLKEELNFTDVIDNLRYKHEMKIMNAVLKSLGITGEINTEDITVSQETVQHSRLLAFTVRYKGLLMYRRFASDFFGLKVRYESPIFNNVSEPK